MEMNMTLGNLKYGEAFCYSVTKGLTYRGTWVHLIFSQPLLNSNSSKALFIAVLGDFSKQASG